MRKIHSNVPVLFVPEEWTVTEYGFHKERSLPNETVFSVGNGYLGVRGYFEEGVPSGVVCEQSLLINGVYEYHPYRHIWQRPGFPGRYHSIFSQVNALALKIYADGELWLSDALFETENWDEARGGYKIFKLTGGVRRTVAARKKIKGED